MSYSSKRDHYLFLIILFALSVFSVVMFMPENRLYPGYDAYFHYNRIEALMSAFQDGSFPVYIESEAANGYGYGTKLFYSDFLLIPVALLGLVSNTIFAYKFFTILTVFFSGYFTYIAVNKIFESRPIAYFSALLIAFSYFRFIALFLRCAFGESLSYVFIPIVVWGLYEILVGDSRKWYIFSLGFAFLIMSHLVTSLLTAILALGVILCDSKKLFKDKERIISLLKGGVTVVFLSAYATLMLFEQLGSNTFFLTYHQDLIRPSQTKISLVEYFGGLFSGFRIEDKNVEQYLWDQGAGLILTALIFLRVFVRKRTEQIKLADICLVLGVILSLATTQLFPWGRYPFTLLKGIQFPWRLFEYVTFFFAVAGATYLVTLLRTKRLKLSFGVLVGLTVIMIGINSYNYRNSFFLSKASPIPSMDNSCNLGSLEYTPAKFAMSAPSFWSRIWDREERVTSKNDNTTTTQYSHVKSNISFHIDTKSSIDTITSPMFYYKGYVATFEGKELPVEQSETGELQLVLNGKGYVEVDFKGTLIQRYSFFITIVSFVLLFFYIYIRKGSPESA